MGTESGRRPDARRRRFVLGSLKLVPALMLMPTQGLLLGCGNQADDATAGPLTFPLADLPLGARVRLENGGAPVEVQRGTDGIIARSLLCTHQGCRVRWHEEEQLYICPCHDGKFDAAGEVVYGMPTRPLRELVVAVKADHVVISR